jgi:hypothetical protein
MGHLFRMTSEWCCRSSASAHRVNPGTSAPESPHAIRTRYWQSTLGISPFPHWQTEGAVAPKQFRFGDSMQANAASSIAHWDLGSRRARTRNCECISKGRFMVQDPNESWIWNGSEWTPPTLGKIALVGRTGSSMAYDASRNVGCTVWRLRWQRLPYRQSSLAVEGECGMGPTAIPAISASVMGGRGSLPSMASYANDNSPSSPRAIGRYRATTPSKSPS